MEEEGARRRKYNGRGGAGTRGFLSGLNEDDEDEEEDETPAPSRNIPSSRVAQPRKAVSPASPTPKPRKGPKTFELDMESATLLGRRHKRGGGVGVSSPLASGNVTASDHFLDPGSPMRL